MNGNSKLNLRSCIKERNSSMSFKKLSTIDSKDIVSTNIYDDIDKLVGELVNERVIPFDFTDFLKLNLIGSFKDRKLNLNNLKTIFGYAEECSLIFELMMLPFFTEEKRCDDSPSHFQPEGRISRAFSSYITFNIRFLIMSELDFISLKLVEGQAGLLLGKLDTCWIQHHNLILFYLIYSPNIVETTLEVKAKILFELFDSDSHGFIESTTRSYLATLKHLIYFLLFFSDALLNYSIISNCVKMSPALSKFLSFIKFDFNTSNVESVTKYKKLLFFMIDSKLMKDFINYVSHNFIFEGRNSNNKLRIKDFMANLQKTSFNIFSPEKMRIALIGFIYRGKSKEIEFFLEEIPHLINFHHSCFEDSTNSPERSINQTKYKMTKKSSSKTIANSLHVFDKFVNYEAMLKSEGNFEFYRASREYNIQNLKMPRRKPKSMKFTLCNPSIIPTTKSQAYDDSCDNEKSFGVCLERHKSEHFNSKFKSRKVKIQLHDKAFSRNASCNRLVSSSKELNTIANKLNMIEVEYSRGYNSHNPQSLENEADQQLNLIVEEFKSEYELNLCCESSEYLF